jgi:hypothetical protein
LPQEGTLFDRARLCPAVVPDHGVIFTDTRIFPFQKRSALLIVTRHTGRTETETVSTKNFRTIFLKVEIFRQMIQQGPVIAL